MAYLFHLSDRYGNRMIMYLHHTMYDLRNCMAWALRIYTTLLLWQCWIWTTKRLSLSLFPMIFLSSSVNISLSLLSWRNLSHKIIFSHNVSFTLHRLLFYKNTMTKPWTQNHEPKYNGLVDFLRD